MPDIKLLEMIDEIKRKNTNNSEVILELGWLAKEIQNNKLDQKIQSKITEKISEISSSPDKTLGNLYAARVMILDEKIKEKMPAINQDIARQILFIESMEIDSNRELHSKEKAELKTGLLILLEKIQSRTLDEQGIKDINDKIRNEISKRIYNKEKTSAGFIRSIVIAVDETLEKYPKKPLPIQQSRMEAQAIRLKEGGKKFGGFMQNMFTEKKKKLFETLPKLPKLPALSTKKKNKLK